MIRCLPRLCALAAVPFALAACDPPEQVLPGILVEDVGFQTPESVQHEAQADVYLVSNINGDPLEHAGNGFISRLSPEGEVLDLRWIDGEDEGVTLHAPKGMAFRDDLLFVADIDCVRAFHRETGEPVEEICIEGATFLNAIAVHGDDGSLFVTDSGLQAGEDGLEASGTDAVYRIMPDGEVILFAEGEELGNPNGITYSPRGVIVSTFGTGELYALDPAGQKISMMPESDRMLDGLLALPDNQGFLFSDWEEQTVVRVQPDGTLSPVIQGVEAPADIGFDELRGRILIPLFMDDAVRLLDYEL